MQLKKRDEPLYTIDEIFEMNGITTPIKENNMNYDKLVKYIESWKHYVATYYTRDEVTKIITEPVTHVYVVDTKTDDEYDIVNDRGSWVISCDRAEATGLAEICMILNLFEDDEE